MNYNLVYFSPTYTTKKIVKLIAGDITSDTLDFDITNPNVNVGKLIFTQNDFVIMGIPVYSGRVPQIAANYISSMSGSETPAALIATYGNRHYDDSLLELKNIVQSKGFIAIAAAAFVTEHSVVPKFGAGRPNDDDTKEIHKFAELLKSKITSFNRTSYADLKVKGNPKYRNYQSIPIKPHTKSSCTKCGVCAKNCPTNAIPLNNPKRTDKSKCITCMRCIRICPQKSRGFYSIERFIAERSLEKLCREYRQSEIFI